MSGPGMVAHIRVIWAPIRERGYDARLQVRLDRRSCRARAGLPTRRAEEYRVGWHNLASLLRRVGMAEDAVFHGVVIPQSPRVREAGARPLGDPPPP